MRVARPVVLSPEQKEALEHCARARSRSVRMIERARIVLLAASGKQDSIFGPLMQARPEVREMDAVYPAIGP